MITPSGIWASDCQLAHDCAEAGAPAWFLGLVIVGIWLLNKYCD